MTPPRRGRPRAPLGRGAAFPAELRGTLGTLLRTTLMSARDALERGAREGRARFDDVRLERRRDAAVAELGERVLDLVRRGDLPELEQLPELADALAVIEDLDARVEGRDTRDEGRAGRDWVVPETRSRFDRGRGSSEREREREPDRDRDRDRERVRDRGDRSGDGTVSSASWRPPPPKEPSARVWKPGEIDVKAADLVESTHPPRGDDTRPLRPRDVGGHAGGAEKKGGIVFGGASDDDDDLADYMHPDDVPAKK